MTPEFQPSDARLSEAEAREILRRAAERDASDGRIALSDLVRSANEAGISEESVGIAAAEVLALRTSPNRSRSDAHSRRSVVDILLDAAPWRLIIRGAALGAATGLAELLVLDNSMIDVPSFLVLAAACALLIDRHKESPAAALSSVSAMLIGYGLGWSAVNFAVTFDLLLATTGAGLLASAFTAVRDRVRQISQPV